MRRLIGGGGREGATFDDNLLTHHGYGDYLFLSDDHFTNEDFTDLSRFFLRLKGLFTQPPTLFQATIGGAKQNEAEYGGHTQQEWHLLRFSAGCSQQRPRMERHGG